MSKRPADEVRYGRLWAEVELPKLLAKNVQSVGEQPTVKLHGSENLKTK
jgi:hypothetical protein